jgi:hypothetical protein
MPDATALVMVPPRLPDIASPAISRAASDFAASEPALELDSPDGVRDGEPESLLRWVGPMNGMVSAAFSKCGLTGWSPPLNEDRGGPASGAPEAPTPTGSPPLGA